jgi:hypothetical protein
VGGLDDHGGALLGDSDSDRRFHDDVEGLRGAVEGRRRESYV